jgi:putative DNA primase/helicase
MTDTGHGLTDAVFDDDDDHFALNITDASMGLYMANQLQHVIRYVADEARWIIWNGKCWDWDDEVASMAHNMALVAVNQRRREVMEAPNREDNPDWRANALTAISRFESTGKLKAIVDVCSRIPAVRTVVDALDNQPNEICCLNGMVNLDTGALREHNPDDLCTKLIPYEYDPKAAKESKPLTQYLETFMPVDEDHRFVFAVLGDSLRMGNERRILPIFWGGTTSGKSQLFGALHKLLGPYICTIGSGVFRANLDDKPRPDLVMAMYTRVAYAQEASKAWALHADQIKRLTGNDTLPYRNLFTGMVNRTPRFTPLLVTNEMPRITNADEALKRRILAIHFDQTISVGKEDPNIRQRFLADDSVMRGLLALLVAGAHDPIINEPPERFMLATMRAREGLDHVDEFLDFMREEGWILDAPPDTPDYKFLPANELFKVYTAWVKNYADTVDKRDVLGRNKFNDAMRNREWISVGVAGVRWIGKQWISPQPVRLMTMIGVDF